MKPYYDEKGITIFHGIGEIYRDSNQPVSTGGITIMKVIRNTYPKYPNVPCAEPGDTVHWEISGQGYRLIRDIDGKSLFCTAPVDKDGNRRSTKTPPVLIGIIAEVKSKRWILEVAQEILPPEGG